MTKTHRIQSRTSEALLLRIKVIDFVTRAYVPFDGWQGRARIYDPADPETALASPTVTFKPDGVAEIYLAQADVAALLSADADAADLRWEVLVKPDADYPVSLAAGVWRLTRGGPPWT